jgi:serine/threonine protein kinase
VVCPNCGYNADEERNPIVLPYKTALNNKFLVGRMLGKPGGFGITYLAWDSVLHTTVAIKEYLPRDLATRASNGVTVLLLDPKEKDQFIFGLHQFLKEARTLAQFSHPNVVRAREFFQQNNTAYLVMDYYEGVSLEEFVQKKGGKVSEQNAFNIMLPILDGLREVHQKGFLHRDIKPANIYLTKGELPILLDFGAARFAVSQKVERPSMIITEGFAPFEQYLEDADGMLGPWTDIYAYGATLYAISTGVTPMNAINRYHKDELLSPIQIVPTLTPQFSRAIMAALTLDHDQRPQSVQALQSLLLSGTNNSPYAANENASYRATPVNISDFNKSQEQTQRSVSNAQSIRCPYCRTINTVAYRQDINKLHCYQCGKKVSTASAERKFAHIIWGLGVLTVVLAGVLVFKLGRDMMSEQISSNEIAETIAPIEPKTPEIKEEPAASEPANVIEVPVPEIKIENTDITPPVLETSSEEPLVKLAEEPVPAAPIPAKPPEFAVIACKDKHEHDYCEANNGSIQGNCYSIMQQLVCIPKEHNR